MKLYLTRHGETAWNKEDKVCGRTDLPLNETGVAQARQTCEKLAAVHFDRVVCSPMLRARQTAALICEGRDIPIEHDMRLIEQDYGIYEGVDRHDEGFLNNKRSFATRYPGGESHMSTALRVYACLEDWAARCPEESILMVCHGGVCRVIESYFHDLTNEEFFRFAMHNCEVREYEIAPNPPAPGKPLKFYGSKICGDCREALCLFEQHGFREYTYIDITASTANLKEFLALRDSRPELAEARGEGRIGIPCFLHEDGSLSFDPEEFVGH